MCAQVIKQYGSFIVLNDYCARIDRFSEGGCKSSWDNDSTIVEMQNIIKKKHFDLFNFYDIHINQPIKLKRRKR